MLEGFGQGSDVIWFVFKENNSGMETRLVGVTGERQQREELIDYYSIEVEMKVT